MKRCVKCAEKIQSAATTCRYCDADQPKAESKLPLVAVIIGVIAVLLILRPTNNGSRQPVADPVKAAQDETLRKETEQRRREAGKHCQLYSGEVYQFSRLVKANMRNPASFEHVATTLGPLDRGGHAIVMEYRGTNGFGAIDTSYAMGEISNYDCAAKLVKM